MRLVGYMYCTLLCNAEGCVWACHICLCVTGLALPIGCEEKPCRFSYLVTMSTAYFEKDRLITSLCTCALVHVLVRIWKRLARSKPGFAESVWFGRQNCIFQQLFTHLRRSSHALLCSWLGLYHATSFQCLLWCLLVWCFQCLLFPVQKIYCVCVCVCVCVCTYGGGGMFVCVNKCYQAEVRGHFY